MQCLVQYCPCLQFVLHQTLLLTLLYLFKRCLGYGINLSFVTNSSSFAVWYRKLQNFVSLQLGTGVLPKRCMVHGIVFDFVSSIVGVAVVGTLPTGQWCGRSSTSSIGYLVYSILSPFLYTPKKVTYYNPRYIKLYGTQSQRQRPQRLLSSRTQQQDNPSS